MPRWLFRLLAAIGLPVTRTVVLADGREECKRLIDSLTPKPEPQSESAGEAVSRDWRRVGEELAGDSVRALPPPRKERKRKT